MKLLLEIDELEVANLEMFADQGESMRVWIRNTSGLTLDHNYPQYYFRGQLWIKPLATIAGTFVPIHGAISLNLGKLQPNTAQQSMYYFSCWHNAYMERLSILIESKSWLQLLLFNTSQL